MSQSPFAEYIDSYYPPSKDTPGLKDYITQDAESLKALEREIEETERALDALKARHRNRTTELDKHRSLLSPIKVLPPDLLTSIFLACNPSHVSYHETSLFSRPMPTAERELSTTVRISHVCRTWRQLALATPTLWTKIGLYLPDCTGAFHGAGSIPDHVVAKWKRALERDLEGLEVCLERSGMCPLSIAFISLEPLAPTSIKMDWLTGIFEKMVDVLLGSTKRWRSLECDMTVGPHTQTVLRLVFIPPEDLLLLERVKQSVILTAAAPSDAAINIKILEDIRLRAKGPSMFAAPRINSISLSDWWTPLHQIPVDWANLTQLSFGGYIRGMDLAEPNPFPEVSKQFSAAEALTILSRCPNLITCSLCLAQEPFLSAEEQSADLSNGGLTKISLPALTTLRLNFQILNTAFAASLDLPALHSLFLISYSVPNRGRRAAAAGISGCLKKWGPNLKAVRFNYSALAPAEFMECLEVMGDVEKMYLDSFVGYPDQFDLDLDGNANGGEVGSAGEPWSWFNGDILRKMTVKYDEGCGGVLEVPLLPKLRVFRCRASVQAELPVEEVVNMIASRRRVELARDGIVARLEDVNLTNNGDFRGLDIEDRLKEMGVDMEGFRYSTVRRIEEVYQVKYYEPYIQPYESVEDIVR